MFEIIEGEQTPNLEPMEDPAGFIEENKEFLGEFLNFARKHQHAVGLASNQVKYNGEQIKDRFAAVMTTAGWLIAVDPKVVKTEGDVYMSKEGCLSWPGKTIAAERHPKIDVECYLMNGEKHTRHADLTIEAKIWQHEINHLNGIEEKVVPNDFFTVKRDGPKVGRNSPCPCGSGDKYKRCCGKR
jgi:peptide deformylase